MLPTTRPAPLSRPPSARLGVWSLALLLGLPLTAFADGGVRRGGARRAPPPPPPDQGQIAPRARPAQAPVAPRSLPASAPQARTSAPDLGAAERAQARQPATRQPATFQPATLPRAEMPSFVGVRPLQLGGARPAPTTRERSTQPSPAATWTRPASPVSSGNHMGGTRTATLPGAPASTRPLPGTAASPTWDNLRRPATRPQPAPAAMQPVAPRFEAARAGSPDAVRSALERHTGGVRPGYLPPTSAGTRTASTPTYLSTGGAPRAPGAHTLPSHRGGVHYAGSRGGVAPAAHGGGVAYGSRHRHGYGWGWFTPRPLYAAPTYVESSLVVNLWGFGSCCCEPPLLVEPAPSVWLAPPAYEPAPLVEPYAPYAPAPTWTAPQAPSAPPAAPAPSTPTWPEPNPLPPEAPQGEEPAPDPAAEAELTPEDQQALERSLEAFRREAYDEALRVLEDLAQRRPKLGHAWLGLAHAAFAAGRIPQAAQALTQAALLGAFPRGYAFDPSVLYATPEAFRSRKDALAREVAARPQDADARLVFAWLLASLQQRDQARAEIDALLRLRPADEAAPILALALLPAVPPVEPQAPPQAPTGRPTR